jgi:hypothetical protein
MHRRMSRMRDREEPVWMYCVLGVKEEMMEEIDESEELLRVRQWFAYAWHAFSGSSISVEEHSPSDPVNDGSSFCEATV